MGNCGSSATVPSSNPPQVQAGYAQEKVQSTHPTSKHTSGPSSVAPSPKDISEKPAHDTSRHEGEIPLPNAAAVAPERVRSRAASQRRRDSRGSPSSSSGGVVVVTQRTHRPEMLSNKHSSSKRGSLQRDRAMSMDTTFSQEDRLRSSGQRTRTTSASLLGNRHPPAGTRSESRQVPRTGRMTAKRQESRPPFPPTVQSLLSNDFRFRILVVGKRESGKSSLINAVFNVDMSVAPKNVPGRTAEFRPRDNRHLIVHECSGFGPEDLEAIRDFVTIYSHKNRPASERLHAIWICVPVSDAISGQFDESLKILSGIGVPLVLVFTKFDLIVPNVSFNTAGGNDYESARATAYMKCDVHRRSLSGNVRAEIVSTRPMFRDFIEKLVTTTDEVITAHSRNISASSGAQKTQPGISPVALAWSVSQRANRDVNIQASIEVGRSRYWRSLGSSDDFAGRTLANCVEVIHADIVSVWNLPDKDSYLSGNPLKVEISYLVQDLSTPSRSQANGTPRTGAAWLNNRYENSNENICLVVGYIVDLTLILCRVFSSPGDTSSSKVQSVMNHFAGSALKSNIHAEIGRFIETVPKFKYHDNDIIVEKVIDLVTQNCDPPSGDAQV